MLATIGFFDGVHKGHKFLISQVKEQARMRGLRSAVITFDRHPREVIYNKVSKLLTPADEKVRRLKAEGIDECIVIPFTLGLSQLSAYEFMQMLRDDYGIKALQIGFDNCFGHGLTDGYENYVMYGEKLGIDIMQAKPMLIDEEKVSSSKIKALLAEGRVEDANSLLGYEYRISGKVVKGNQIGTSIGFPTANIGCVPEDKLIPKAGAYVATALGHKAMLNIGTNPTVSESNKMTIEVHIDDFNEDLYGQELTVSLCRRLRDEQCFPSLAALKRQLSSDLQEVRNS